VLASFLKEPSILRCAIVVLQEESPVVSSTVGKTFRGFAGRPSPAGRSRAGPDLGQALKTPQNQYKCFLSTASDQTVNSKWHFCNRRTHSCAAAVNCSKSRQDQRRFERWGKVCRTFSPLLLRSVDELMGCLMKSAIANLGLPDEHFVVQVDGQARSEHRRFVDALIAGLLLRNKLPLHEVKVLETKTKAQAADMIH
jgi:hypothetical protein